MQVENDFIVPVQVCGVESARLRFKAIRQEPKRLGHFVWNVFSSRQDVVARCPNQSAHSIFVLT